MNKEKKFYKILQDIFIGAKIEGKGGFINLMRIKSTYYSKIENILKKDIENALQSYPNFRDELFDKLYSFFNRYFTESGSIYFNSTPFHNNIYEKVYTDNKDVILFWKTQMLYYVKTDRIFKNLEIESYGFKFFFDVSNLECKKANEKRTLIYEFKKVREDGIIVFSVQYSEKGKKTKTDEILKAIKKNSINITEEQLEHTFKIFEKQSEVDFFINKNAKAFLQEQFKLWSYQYFWEGAKEWSADRINQLQILKNIAFKIIDFISQFEDELVKIWNKPKFVKNSNYVITLDRIKDKRLIKKIFEHTNINEQVKEWQELGIIKEKFNLNDVFENLSSMNESLEFSSIREDKEKFNNSIVKWYELPFNPELKEKARELRKAGNLSEVLLWKQIKNKQLLGLDFDRQKIIGNYIVDFYCKNLGVVVEIDGVSHDGKIEYDLERDTYLKGLGLKVIHISDLDVKNNLEGVVEFLKSELSTLSANVNTSVKGELNNEHPVPSGHPSIRGEFMHLPIDTKYFKDLEFEILSQFEDLDKSLDGWLIKSDNYQALNTILPKFKGKVQTIYIDPPFNTGEDFMYMDRFQDSCWITLMENRLTLSKELLKGTGSFYLHLDSNADYFGRILLDNIFGKYNFRVKITWKRHTGPKVQSMHFPNISDFILVYSKDESKWVYNPQYIPYKKEYIEKIYKYEDKNGKYRIHDLYAPGEGPARIFTGREIDPPTGHHWSYAQDKIDKMIKEGRIFFDNKGFPKLKVYLGKGEQITNIWTDINVIQGGSNEFLNFKTQKPEKLLLRIIEASTNFNDLVLDFFLGVGTTTAVAHKLGRKWIGIEMGEHFYTKVLPRMKKVLYYDPSGISKELRTPRQTLSTLPLTERNSHVITENMGNTTEFSEIERDNLIISKEKGNTIQFPQQEGNIPEFHLNEENISELSQNEENRPYTNQRDENTSHPNLNTKNTPNTTNQENNNSPSLKGCQPQVDGVVYQGGGFFKYYELEQYEEALTKCKYEDADLFTIPDKSPYQEYVFLKDEKMLKALEIDYENNKVKIDLPKIYPNPSAPFGTSIDIAETLSNLTGKWIKKITLINHLEDINNSPSLKGNQPQVDGVVVEFEDGTKINIKDLDYKLIKPLIWWE